MENTDQKLSFPQRNWLLLCIVVAILSPLVVHWIQNGADKVSYQQSVDIKSKDSSYKMSNSPGSAATGDSSAKTSDSVKH
jgi:hypothetical protein